ALVVSVAAIAALLIIFAKPLAQGVRALFEASLPTAQTANLTDQPIANNSPAERPRVLANKIASAVGTESTGIPANIAASAPAGEPSATARAPQTSLAAISNPSAQESSLSKHVVRGVTDSEIRFGILAPLSGAAKELGQNMRLGIEAAFNAANANDGIFGRKLRLVA